jgi:tetratricopeptide (TPR) repeat protein
MKHGNLPLRSPLQRVGAIIALALSLVLTAAHADEYGDVNQLVRAGKLSEAMAKADQYLAAKPRDPQMRFIKGVIQREIGKTADAIATFTKLTEDYPELPEPYNNLAVLHASQGQHDKARAALEMAIRTNPSYATAHENLGDIYAKLASQAYSKALQIDSSATSPQPKLALIRELFNPQARGQRPTTAPAVATAAAPPAAAPAPTPTAPTTTTAPAAPAKPAAAVPPPSASPAASAPAASSSADTRDAEAAVRAWAKAWAAKDMSNYLGAYGKEFVPPGGLSRSAWESERRKRIVGKTTISLKLEQLTVTVNGNKAVAKFRQDYKADALAVSSRKTIDLVKTGDRWLIVRESVGN